MPLPDLNLLIALDVLLAEGSVTRAARRLRLSPSAMSRTLARLREATGDPLLVRAGRALVPTPRALALREKVAPLLGDILAVLGPEKQLDPRQLEQTFTLRASDGFVENFGPALLAHVGAQAPGVRLRFVQKIDRESVLLRDGSIDLETGVIGSLTGPEVCTRRLFGDRFVGVVRSGHPLARGEISAARYAAGQHVLVARRDQDTGPMDDALAALGLRRSIASIVGGFTAALALAAGSDLIATVPERHTGKLRAGMFCFALPLGMPELSVSLMWHPRMDADPAHRWLRGCVVDACADQLGGE